MKNSRLRVRLVALFLVLACGTGVAVAGVLWKQERPNPGGEPERWDRIFSAKKPRFRTEPNDFLDRSITRLSVEKWLTGGTALDLAMGDGRNALLLAKRGFTVSGIDVSKVALDLARGKAKEQGLELDAREADLFTFDYGVDRWDLISVIYYNPALEIAPKLQAAVKPGGIMIIEGQGSEHQGDGPPMKSRFAPNQLLTTFKGWRILAYEDGRFESDWNLGEPIHVVRLMARKPDAK